MVTDGKEYDDLETRTEVRGNLDSDTGNGGRGKGGTDSTALSVESLHVRRAYGVEVPVRAALRPGVNVVHGPNGQGKTTLGHALHALLWPEAAAERRLTLDGRFRYGATWEVELEGSRRRALRDGVETPLPHLVPQHPASYRLDLTDLLQADGADFARLIRRQAEGGMDVAAAAKALGFARATGRPTGGSRNVDAARSRVKEVQQRQYELRQKEVRLATLQTDIDAAAKAQRHAALLDLVLRAQEAQRGVDMAREAHGELPNLLSRLTGEEGGEWERLEATCGEAEKEIRRAEKMLVERKEEREAHRLVPSMSGSLPNAGLQPNAETLLGRLSALTEQARRLGTLESEQREFARQLQDARTRADGAWTSTGIRPDEGSDDAAPGASATAPDATVSDATALDATARDAKALAERITSEQVQRLGAYASRLRRLQAEAQAEAARRQVLGTERVDVLDEAASTLGQGRNLLHLWLRTTATEDPAAKHRARMAAWGTAGGLAVVAVAAAVLWHPAAALLLLGALALVVLPLLLLRQAPGAGGDIERSFARLPLDESADAPRSWTRDDVITALDALERRLADVLRRRALAHHRDARGPDERFKQEMEALQEDRQAILQALGVDPGDRPEQLFFLVRALADWRDAHRGALGTEAKMETASRQHAEACSELNAKLSAFGLDPVTSAKEAHEATATVQALITSWETLSRQVDEAEQALERARAEEKRATDAFRSFRDRLEGVSDLSAVRALCAQVETYRARSKALDEARGAARSARQEVEARDDASAALLNQPSDELEADREAAREKADTLDALKRERDQIEALVKAERQSHNLESAQAALREARETLSHDFEEAAGKTVGHLLASHVETASRERSLPPVFHRARELFARFTRDAYELRLGQDQAFAAFDRQAERVQPLEALSSGTRVQLLLAVRMAFVETQEQGVRLPVVLDETLATSDDARALAVMEAVLDLCADGRQVVYLSAQDDEVAKWLRVAEERGVDCHVVPLPGATPEVAAEPPKSLAPAVPPPNGRDHTDYRRVLGVPRWTPHAPEGALHAWYLVECPDRLHRLVENGYATWGPLRGLVERGQGHLFGVDAAEAARLKRCGDAVRAWAAAWREGRGKPVDRAVLEQCGAVSETFLDRVAELCGELGGDARALVDALRERQIKGFYSSRADDLEAYFDQEGYLDARERLSPAACWDRVVAAMGVSLEANELDRLRRTVERVQAGVPG